MNSPSFMSRRAAIAGLPAFFLAGFATRSARAQAKSFLIFFAKDTAELSDIAKQIVFAMKPAMKPNMRLTIAGHCDTSEKEPDKLSLARANAVLAVVNTMELPPGATFALSGDGTAGQHVPTGPNTPEPQNRYVSIKIE